MKVLPAGVDMIIDPGDKRTVMITNTISDRNVDIHSLDIAVNAVATAVKDFVYNRLPEILPPEQMEDLEELASKMECISFETFI